MKKRQFFSAVLSYLFIISMLPIGLIFNKVKAVEISKDYTDYNILNYRIIDSAMYKDSGILSTDYGVFSVINGKVICKDNTSQSNKSYMGEYMGKYNNYAYFQNINELTEFNLTTGNYSNMKLPINIKDPFYIGGSVVDNQGNKWFSLTSSTNEKQSEHEYYLLRMNAGDNKCKMFSIKDFNATAGNLKCDANNNIWFQDTYKSYIIGRATLDLTKDEITTRKFQLSEGRYPFWNYEVGKDGNLFAVGYNYDKNTLEFSKYKEVNGNMVFDKTTDLKNVVNFTKDNIGNLWFLSKGDKQDSNYKVCKLENETFVDKYVVSNVMRNLKVYDDNHILLTGRVMFTENDTYKVIDTTKVIDNPAAGWNLIGEKWYYMNSDGQKRIGWVSVENMWYYLGGDGAMKANWVLVGNTWYYFYGDGHMARNTTIDGYKVNSDGAWIK